MRDHFRVGLGFEAVAFALELPFELEIVLDDAVVHDHEVAAAVAVRVGVFLSRPAVGRPAGVADTVVAVHRMGANDVLEPVEFARAPAHVDFAAAHQGDPGRVVASILEPSQAVDQHRHRRFVTEVANDAAHGEPYLDGVSPRTPRRRSAGTPSI